MTRTEVDPKDYMEIITDPDGFSFESDTLPVDEWRCTSCETPVGWVLWEGQWGEASVTWHETWVDRDADARKSDTKRYCEVCRDA